MQFHGLDRDTSLVRKCLLLGPYIETMPRALAALGGGRVLMSKVPLNMQLYAAADRKEEHSKGSSYFT